MKGKLVIYNKTTYLLTFDLPVLFLGIYPEDTQHNNAYVQFTVALFVIVQYWKEIKSLCKEECLNKLYMYKMQCYLTVWKDEEDV